MKIALGLEYCGTAYKGWQKQKHSQSVQECVESALSMVADSPIEIHCAGRTDAGVHARNQVVHFETDVVREPHSWVLGTNVNLPGDISVNWALPVAEEFHARFSAIGRIYQYTILNRLSRPGLLQNRVAWEYRRLDEKLMQLAAKTLLGEHDFTSYRSAECQAKSPVRTIRRIDILRNQDFIHLEIEANAFLHHMVRNIAGVLIKIGMGKEPPEWTQQVLDARDRTAGGVTAPAQGLYLASVQYPDKFSIPVPDIACFGIK